LRQPGYQPGYGPWLGVDAVGHVAYFDPEDFGPIPVKAAAYIDDELDIEQRIEALPVRGDYSVIPNSELNVTPAIEAARRGVFTFDYGWNHIGPFERIAVPLRPIAVEELPDRYLKSAAVLVRLSSVHFAASEHIRVSELDVQLEPPDLDGVEQQLRATNSLMVKALRDDNLVRARHLRASYAQLSEVLIEVYRLSRGKPD
jgi:hypothetical protein